MPGLRDHLAPAALGSPWRWALLAACAVWLLVLAAPPLLAAGGLPSGELVRWPLRLVCHQDPARSFHLFGEPLAVCARCTGLYVGFAAGVLLWPHLGLAARALAQRPRYVLLFFVPLAIDWGLVDNTAPSRLATGIVAAFPMGLLALLALGDLLPRHRRPAPGAGVEGPC